MGLQIQGSSLAFPGLVPFQVRDPKGPPLGGRRATPGSALLGARPAHGASRSHVLLGRRGRAPLPGLAGPWRAVCRPDQGSKGPSPLVPRHHAHHFVHMNPINHLYSLSQFHPLAWSLDGYLSPVHTRVCEEEGGGGLLMFMPQHAP